MHIYTHKGCAVVICVPMQYISIAYLCFLCLFTLTLKA